MFNAEKFHFFNHGLSATWLSFFFFSAFLPHQEAHMGYMYFLLAEM